MIDGYEEISLKKEKKTKSMNRRTLIKKYLFILMEPCANNQKKLR